MGNCNEVILEEGINQKALFFETESEAASTKMTKYIDIIGVYEPEKLAEGQCPHCKTMVTLWASPQGLELSPHDYIMLPTFGINCIGQRESRLSGNPTPTPIIVDGPISSHKSMNMNNFSSLKHWLLSVLQSIKRLKA